MKAKQSKRDHEKYNDLKFCTDEITTKVLGKYVIEGFQGRREKEKERPVNVRFFRGERVIGI